MFNNRIIKMITIPLIIAFIMTFALPSPEVFSQNTVAFNEKIYIEDVKESETSVSSYSDNLIKYIYTIREALEAQDVKALEEAVDDILKAANDIEKSVYEEIISNEEIILDIDSEDVFKRYVNFKKQLEDNFTIINDYLIGLKGAVISRDFKRIKIHVDKIEKMLDPEKPDPALGSNLPHQNIDIIPPKPATGSGSSSAHTKGASEQEVSSFSKTPEKGDLEETLEVQFTKEIKELGDSFETVVEIYEYVRNNIVFEQYHGSRKGALGTLEQKSGNSFDQASLLISLLRYKGIPTRYVRGTIEVPIERAIGWTGTKTPEAAVRVLGSLGVPTVSVTTGGRISHVRLEHVWVEAYIPYQYYRGIGSMKGQEIWIPLDPSFKEHERVEGIDLKELIGIDKDSVFDNLEDGMIISEDFLAVSRVNVETVLEEIERAEERIEEFLSPYEEDEEIDPIDIFGGIKIVPQNLGLLPSSLPYDVVTVIEKSSKVSDELRESVVFSIRGADPFNLNFRGRNHFEYEVSAPQIYGKRITLSWVPAGAEDERVIDNYGGIFKTPAYLVHMKPQLMIDGKVVVEGDAVGLGYRQEFKMTMKSVGLPVEEIINPVTVGGFYCVGFDYGIITPDELYKIAGNLDRLKGTISEGNIYTDEAMGEILNAVAKAYFAQLNIFDKLLSEKHGVVINKVLSEAMTGYNVKVSHLFMSPVEVNEGGMYIDVDRNAKSVISLNGDKEAQKAYMIASGMIGSAMEHIIFEQMTNVPSVSSIKVLQQANARGIPIHMVTTENINEVLPILEVSNSVKRDIRDSVNAGRIVQIPERNIQYFDWYGTGSAGYMISGGIAGGAMSVGEVLVRYFTYVVSGLITMALFHIAGILILSVTPIGWLGAVLMIGKVLKYALIGIVLISFIYNATRLIEFYRVTGDVYYLQELLIQISSLTTILALNFGPFKGINQEIHVLKHTIIQMKQIGIPAKITFQFAATYGMGRIDPATKAIKFFKDYGLSNSAIETIGKSFDSKGIALIETTFIKSAITYTGSEANTIIILFKQAGNINAATTLSNSLINLSKSGIIPSTFNNYGIMSNITSITEASDALVKGITSPLIKKLFGHGIKPTDYNTLGITNPQMADAVDQIAERYGADGLNALQKGIKPDLINRLADNGIRPVNYELMGITTPQMAETMAKAVEALKPLGLATEQNIARFTKLTRAGVTKENIINVIQNNIRSSSYIQKKIIDTFEEFGHLDDASKWVLKNGADNGLVDVSTWMGKVSGNLENLTVEELKAIEKYMKQGKDLFRIPEGNIKTPDFIVDGIYIEFKGIVTNDLVNARSNALQYAKDSFLTPPAGKGADRLVLDFVSNTDISLNDAKAILQEIKSLYPEKSVEVWTKLGDFIQ
ncbi:UNVERIFIED_CONTAM: Transglutaminase-like enzymes, putative cysteine proteases [Acetivibrio alkalicellulosi]